MFDVCLIDGTTRNPILHALSRGAMHRGYTLASFVAVVVAMAVVVDVVVQPTTVRQCLVF